MTLDLSFDEVLTTTRAVRRRLDLDRAVDLETVRDCLRIAVQAPTGGSIERWRWVLVQEPDVREQVAEIYRAATAEVFKAAEAAAPSDNSRKAYKGARALAEVLERVPLLVFPCVEGEPRAWTVSGAATFYGSIIPAVWSFQLALRSRGLGSTYITAHLRAADAMAKVLGIPEGVTQVAMLPVAHTLGTDFKPAGREPVEGVTYLDRWGQGVPGWTRSAAVESSTTAYRSSAIQVCRPPTPGATT